MNKKFLSAIVLSSTVLLAGCFGTNEELAKGVSLYEKGDEASLSEARLFFTDYLEKNPGDGDAEKYITKIDEQYIVVGKEAVDNYFSEGDVLRAYEVMQNLALIAPNDAEIQEAFVEVEKMYGEQVEFDKYTTYLEDVYKLSFEAYSSWDEVISAGVLGKYTAKQVIDHSKVTLERISAVRKIVQDKSLTLENTNFIETNKILFEYLNTAESNFSRVATSSLDMMEVYDIRDRTSSFSPEFFNQTFSAIKSNMDYYVSEADAEGTPIRNINNSLSFDYDEISARQKEEAAEKLAEEQEAPAAEGTVEEPTEEDAK